jgi:hypothetical protein
MALGLRPKFQRPGNPSKGSLVFQELRRRWHSVFSNSGSLLGKLLSPSKRLAWVSLRARGCARSARDRCEADMKSMRRRCEFKATPTWSELGPSCNAPSPPRPFPFSFLPTHLPSLVRVEIARPGLGRDPWLFNGVFAWLVVALPRARPLWLSIGGAPPRPLRAPVKIALPGGIWAGRVFLRAGWCGAGKGFLAPRNFSMGGAELRLLECPSVEGVGRIAAALAGGGLRGEGVRLAAARAGGVARGRTRRGSWRGESAWS